MNPIHRAAARRNPQQGMTLISWIIILAFLGFQAVMLMNIIPVYINDNSVKTVMASLESDDELRTASTKNIKINLLKKLKINNVYAIKADNISIKKVKAGVMVRVEYEPRGALVGNLDYIVTFKHEAIIRR